ncbi:MAG: COX15/CtaA family protein [Magnetococcus sp. DMHC-6]
MPPQDQRRIAQWLFICSGLVVAMLALGGLTRLTGSGLSMVEWKPITGIIPPMNLADWQDLFSKYQQSPEFRHINHGMDLNGFKEIFWLEFLHRLLGRLIGFVFFMPFIYFLVTKKIDRPLAIKLGGMFVLGGLQGVMGWLMVKSGLVANPHVSAYRLTAHLALAFLVYALMMWTAFGLYFGQQIPSPRVQLPKGLQHGSWGVLSLVSITAMSGGFVAGAKAGFSYNTFPLMGGQWFPEAYWDLQPAWLNIFENIPAIQWNHRLLATITFGSILAFWFWSRKQNLPRLVGMSTHFLLLAAILQIALGISTLLLRIPIALASLHQVGAILVFTLILFIHFHLQLGSKPSI